ncbi:hypothetical protein M3Y98_00664000 [Aphelenchoides besseyi]|nr:hypothetical protein M3Y98_00664000 [Aphelenchoides besseyi]KAI6208824.1 hypothetical protein M3Y96_00156000 [Aphelenchoides besseyi]
MNGAGTYLHPKYATGGLGSTADSPVRIPVFHVILVVASVLLIVCAILVALGIYLRVLQVARRNHRQGNDSKSRVGNSNGNRQNSAPLLHSQSLPPIRQQLQIKIEEF